MTLALTSCLKTADLGVKSVKPVPLEPLTSADGGPEIRAPGGAGHLLLALQLEPVVAEEHQHAPPRLATERDVPVVHAIREAACVTCAEGEDRRRQDFTPRSAPRLPALSPAWTPRPTVPSGSRTTGRSGD